MCDTNQHPLRVLTPTCVLTPTDDQSFIKVLCGEVRPTLPAQTNPNYSL